VKKLINNIFYFLPVQLVLLHLRKYRLLLVFWVILFLVIKDLLASHFGASTLFLAPEYLGKASFTSMFLLGGGMCVFFMTWHITTFIVHSKRMPYMGATRQAFIVYCINNSIIPFVFFWFYLWVSYHFLRFEERYDIWHVLRLELGFALGLVAVSFLSFAYFFSVSRDLIKSVLSKVTNPSRIRNIIPYDSIDYEIDIIPANSYVSGNLRIEKSTDLESYHPRVMNTVLRRHHRNVIFGTFICYMMLVLMGLFMEQPLFRVPAGVGFFLMFSIIMGVVAAMRYFLRSWEAIGWIIIIVSLSVMVKYKLFDLRSIAYGIDYQTPNDKRPKYNYDNLKQIFTKGRYEKDKQQEEGRLDKWKLHNITTDSQKPPLVVVAVSGGGSRSSYWAFKVLQQIDSITAGKLFNSTVLITGASGGMIGSTYWRNLHSDYTEGKIKSPYGFNVQDNCGKDLLNAIIFSFASVDLISPFTRVRVGGYSYHRDRGFAMEQELIQNTEGVLDKNLGALASREAQGVIPQVIFSGSIINDGRKLLMAAQPLGYLTQPENKVNTLNPPIDCIDFATFFAAQNPYNMRTTSAIRMNATFPVILPVVKLPSEPEMNVMDAGFIDNFGCEIASRYLFTMRDWINANTRDVIYLEIRDTRETTIGTPDNQDGIISMVCDPIFSIQNKWEAFESYNADFIKDYLSSFLQGKFHLITLTYLPHFPSKNAELNFHLTEREKLDLLESVNHPVNRKAVETAKAILLGESNELGKSSDL
jgi:hypothetical protein